MRCHGDGYLGAMARWSTIGAAGLAAVLALGGLGACSDEDGDGDVDVEVPDVDVTVPDVDVSGGDIEVDTSD